VKNEKDFESENRTSIGLGVFEVRKTSVALVQNSSKEAVHRQTPNAL
jgi:hypothetical protein